MGKNRRYLKSLAGTDRLYAPATVTITIGDYRVEMKAQVAPYSENRLHIQMKNDAIVQADLRDYGASMTLELNPRSFVMSRGEMKMLRTGALE